MTALFDQISAEKYILLTTYRKDGTPKPTAVNAVRAGHELLLLTPATSWKVKRIRNTPRVTLQACDRTGKKPFGPALDARAAILDTAETKRAVKAVVQKFGLLARVAIATSELRGKGAMIGLSIAE
ncbi:MAG: PPOX class F420-dependent oxidoreductase [Segniliparus sp.]|uniref:PPOX class F420-dependent oxidoreductase n=1 Tax=Segniliparus sp. TaxID=2804064 RepID=UPI003F3708D8